jgi:hypothetical protein
MIMRDDARTVETTEENHAKYAPKDSPDERCAAAREDFLQGTNSFVANSICSGNTYSYRVDTEEALGWITATIQAHGASL